jgi:hypothetical protein
MVPVIGPPRSEPPSTAPRSSSSSPSAAPEPTPAASLRVVRERRGATVGIAYEARSHALAEVARMHERPRARDLRRAWCVRFDKVLACLARQAAQLEPDGGGDASDRDAASASAFGTAGGDVCWAHVFYAASVLEAWWVVQLNRRHMRTILASLRARAGPGPVLARPKASVGAGAGAAAAAAAAAPAEASRVAPAAFARAVPRPPRDATPE